MSCPSFDLPVPESCKAVVLSTAGHRFALPLSAIDRIIHRNLLQSDRNIDGLFYLDQRPLNGIDLSRLLPPPASDQSPPQMSISSEPPFFVIVQLEQTLSGIATDQPPVLMDLPLQEIHAVPAAYKPQLQGLATHMVSLESSSETFDMDSIFLLDLQRVATLVESAAEVASKEMPVKYAV